MIDLTRDIKQLIALLILQRDQKKALLVEFESYESFSEVGAVRMFELEKEVEIIELQIENLKEKACLRT